MEMKYGFLVLGALLICLPAIYCRDDIEYCQKINPPWVKFKGNCYLFNQDWKERVSYYDAEDSCRARGGHLASIHSEEENDFFYRMASAGVFRSRQWIGLNILKGNDTPEWSDGSRVNFTKIVPKEYYKNEKCFIYMRDKKGWRPEDCGLHYMPICKRPEDVTPVTIPPPTTTPQLAGYCKKDWIQFGQKCYKFFGRKTEDRVQYKEARNSCWSLGKNYDLVSIHSMEEQAFLVQHLREFGSSPWIGMQHLESDEIGHDTVFGWTDNSRLDFSYWAKGHPPPGTWKYCARLSFEGVAKGEWVADYCQIDKKGYICQGPADPSLPTPDPEPSTCDSESTGYRNSCYRYFSRPETHDKAEQSCKNIGGHLVSITDSFEQAFLYNFVNSKSKFIWTGLGTVKDTQYLRWTDKQPFYYSNWVDGQPKLNKTKQICTILDSTKQLKWNLLSCSSELPYVCKISGEVSPAFPEVIGNCKSEEKSWIDIGDDYCYHIPQVKNHILSWDSSLRYCISKGMKMLKTDSMHQIYSLIAYLWKEDYAVNLGMIKQFEKDSFMWIDGSKTNFTNWDDREPNNYPEEKGCTAFNQKTGKWMAMKCSSTGTVICQASKIKNTCM